MPLNEKYHNWGGVSVHVCLYDPLWQGHHTDYARLLSYYLLENGHQVTFVTSEHHERIDTFPGKAGLTVRRLRGANQEETGLFRTQAADFRKIRQALRVARDAGADVFHHLSIDFSELSFWVATAGRRTLPTVGSLHRDHFGLAENSGVDQIIDSVICHTTNGLLSTGTVDKLLVHAEPIQNRVVKKLPAATFANIVKAPCPTPDVVCDQTPAEARAALELPVDAPTLLFFGGLRREKGPDILGEALAKLDERITIVFAGPGDDFTSAEVDAWSAAAEDPVKVVNRVGFVPEVEVDEYFQAADALVLPYRRSRGISGPMRRACMANIHIIGSDDSDIGFLINSHDLGQTFSRGSSQSLQETIQTFLANRDACPFTGVELYGDSQHWTTAGQAFERVYDDVTGK